MGLCVLSGVLFGLAPAWRATQIDLHGTLKDAAAQRAPEASGGRRKNLRRALLVSETALPVVLLIGAGLVAL